MHTFIHALIWRINNFIYSYNHQNFLHKIKPYLTQIHTNQTPKHTLFSLTFSSLWHQNPIAKTVTWKLVGQAKIPFFLYGKRVHLRVGIDSLNIVSVPYVNWIYVTIHIGVYLVNTTVYHSIYISRKNHHIWLMWHRNTSMILPHMVVCHPKFIF